MKQFQQIARTLQFPEILLNNHLLQTNPFITTANIWLALKTHKSLVHQEFFFDEAKRMAYTPIILQLEYIQRNRALTMFTNQSHITDAMLVTLAYHLSYYLIDWATSLMETMNEISIATYFVNKENFIKSLNMQHDDEHQRKQRIYIQALLENVKHTDDLMKTINNAIRATHLYLNVRV